MDRGPAGALATIWWDRTSPLHGRQTGRVSPLGTDAVVCMANKGRGQRLRGRAGECATLRGLLSSVQSGSSRVLVLRGEAGVGKTALLEYVAQQASGFRCARVTGVQSDMELAFAGLHQLCAPLLDHLDELPDPQCEALAVAFGRGVGVTPDRFLVGLAVLSLMAIAADDQPLLCVIDDAQWLDQVSVQTLAFVARRLMGEPVALVFAVRDGGPADVLAGLPELVVDGLSDGDARELLDSVLLGRLDERVRDRIIAETRGNPLALLELPRNLSAAELAGGFGNLGSRAGRTDRAELCAADPVPSVSDPTAGACRSSRTGGRRGVVCTRGGAARHSTRCIGAGRSRGSDRVRSAHALSPPVGALGRLPCGRSGGPQGDTSGVGRRN
jgi:hypothetical protein